MKPIKFFITVAALYCLAFGVLAARAGTTNDYTFTGPGLTGLNPLLPLPVEWMSDSGAQAIRQLKAAMLHFVTNATTGQHYTDGSHKTGFVSSVMIGTNVIERKHFEANVTAQQVATNGYAQLPLSDVYVQWCWWTNSSTTSSVWTVDWPTPFTNGVWFATATCLITTNFSAYPLASWSSNEWAYARPVSWTRSNVTGTLNINGTYSTTLHHRVTIMGIGR